MVILFATTSLRLSSSLRVEAREGGSAVGVDENCVDQFTGQLFGGVLQDLAGLQDSHLHLRAHGVPAHGEKHFLLLELSGFLVQNSLNAAGEQSFDGLADGIGGVAFQRSRSAQSMLARLRSGCGCQIQNSTWLGDAAAEVDLPCIDQAAKPDCSRDFGAAEIVLVGTHPGHLLDGDHASGDRLQKHFAESHWFVTIPLHAGAALLWLWLHSFQFWFAKG